MKIAKRAAALICAAALLTALSACASPPSGADSAAAEKLEAARLSQRANLKTLRLHDGAWRYDKTRDVYWQSGVSYCSQPRDAVHETLSVFVPGKYLKGTRGDDGSYTCSVNYSAKVNGYTAATAPMLLAVNTTRYEAKTAPAACRDGLMTACLKAGMIYVSPGLRGNGGENPGSAPWGAVDLKAAVRFLRLNVLELPGDPNRIFAFGSGSGGSLSAVLGASGDSAAYLPYLDAIGAALFDAKGEPISDAVCGVMSWNPAASPDTADSGYEWLVGQYLHTGDRAEGTWTAALSQDLAAAYAARVNGLKLTDAEGTRLTLEPSVNGTDAAGGYAEALTATLEKSLNRCLKTARFPLTVQADGTTRTYQTAEAWMDALNAGGRWISYDKDRREVQISALSGFAAGCVGKTAEVPAGDGLRRQTAENRAFSVSGEESLHFDASLSSLLSTRQRQYAALSGWKSDYPGAYAADLQKTDELGRGAAARQTLYQPLYFLSRSGGGFGSAVTAPYWRVNCGVSQNGAAVLDALNLTLALRTAEAVKRVGFTPVWQQKDALPENSGGGTENFLRWVQSCIPAKR